MPPVHIVNPLANACGGSEWRSLSLFEVLAEHGEVRLWSSGIADRTLIGKYPVRQLDARKNEFPTTGTLVLVGTYFGVPDWIRFGAFDRIVLVHNISLVPELRFAIAVLRRLSKSPVEVVCASQALVADTEGIDLEKVVVERSWIDIERFKPGVAQTNRAFTIGRMSRDVLDKFHGPDGAMFQDLASSGVCIRIMGGNCFRGFVGTHPNIEILAEGAEAPEEFLKSLDAMLYRTSDGWFEAYGRAIVEGMACGVVPVAHFRGGYAEVIESGVDGVLYDSNEEAMSWILKLRLEPSVRSLMSEAARSKAESLYGEAQRSAIACYYFG